MHPSWSLESQYQYNPNRFHTSSGRKSEVKYVRISSDQYRQIEKLVQRRVFPEIETTGDFIRDAIYHRLQFVRDNAFQSDGDFHEVMNAEMMANETLERERAMIRLNAVMDDAKKTVQTLKQEGATQKAKDAVSRLKSQVVEINDDFWREFFYKRIFGMEQELS